LASYPQKKKQLLNTLTGGIIAVIGFFMASESVFTERLLSIRMILYLGSGLTAFVIPYMLFPDRFIALNQLGNLSPREIHQRVWQKCKSALYPVLWLFFIVVFLDLETPLEKLQDKILLFTYGSAFFTGVLLYSASRYFKTGKESQQWQEGEKGADIRKKFAEYAKFPLDPGSVPSLLNTILITAGGMLMVVAGAALSSVFGIAGEAATGGVLLITGLVSWKKTSPHADVYYYSTNAFFREFFGTNIKGQEQTQPVSADQLWWVPPPIRSLSWGLITQLDRKLPTGRVIAAGHFIVWIIAYQRPGEDIMTGAWALFIFAHLLLLIPTGNRDLIPRWWQRYLATPLQWITARFWMQVRWMLPLAISFGVMNLFFGVPSAETQVWLLILYLFVNLVTAITVTLRLNTRIERIYE